MGGALSREDMLSRPIRILCAGDSITEGMSAHQPQPHPYSNELAAMLGKTPSAVHNVGVSGAKIREIQGFMRDGLSKHGRQDLVLVLAGTNDLGLEDADVGAAFDELRDLWAEARKTGARVVAMTMLEIKFAGEFRNRGLALNKLIRDHFDNINQDERLVMFDAYDAFPEEGGNEYWSDPVHPSALGYKRLGEQIGSWLASTFDWDAIRRKTFFRPCIDIHSGVVKQIVGGTLSDALAPAATELKTNFVSEHPASWFAEIYRQYNLTGGHVIMLGPGCEEAAKGALAAWPDRLQVGGGINNRNAAGWITAGASKVIVTSWLFPDGEFDIDRLDMLRQLVGRDRIVVDLSCRRRKSSSSTAPAWTVAMNKWQTLTTLDITNDALDRLADYCSEFLVHAADVEGLQQGVDEALVTFLGQWAARRKERLKREGTLGDDFGVTYAGGARYVDDLRNVHTLSGGFVDLTIGSALDIFGGSGATLKQCIEWNLAIL
ncbi:Enzyme that catalyzes the fourth step in the histidine pathway [Savitreella phatthalungensis]